MPYSELDRKMSWTARLGLLAVFACIVATGCMLSSVTFHDWLMKKEAAAVMPPK